MKTIISIGVLALLILGCSTTAQRKAANTLESVHKTVDAAYDGYIDLVIRGTLKTNSFPVIAGHYTTFQASYLAAVLVVAGDTNGIAPVNITDKANTVTGAIGTALKEDRK
jgi:hypothetical protein